MVPTTNLTKSGTLLRGRTGGWEGKGTATLDTAREDGCWFGSPGAPGPPGPPPGTPISKGSGKLGRAQAGVGAASGTGSFGESIPGQAQDQELFVHRKRSPFYLQLQLGA